MSEKKILYITFSTKPDSFDPLDFDKANNYNFARMLYTTPFEFDSHGTIISSVFSNYQFIKNELLLVLKPDIYFQDGAKITTKDITMAIKRMTLARPKFPVIEHIQGLSKWLKFKYPLKEELPGLIFSDTDIKIKFNLNSNVQNPLFRFTLELFSIVPSSCINLETNKLICTIPTFSGPYKLISGKLGDSLFEFVKNNAKPSNLFELNYKHLDDALQQISATDKNRHTSNQVIMATGESFFDPEFDKKTKRLDISKTPEAWHLTIKLNSHKAPFNDITIRKYFIESLRRKILKDKNSKLMNYSESIFSQLIPGHLDFKNYELTNNNLPRHISFKNIKWINRKNPNLVVREAMKNICRELGLSQEEYTMGSTEASSLIKSGQYDFLIGSTGFWSLDPAGDIKMLFTPNLHGVLGDIANDSKLQKLLDEYASSVDKNQTSVGQTLNQYIHDQYIYNVISHFPFVFLSSKSNKSKIAIPQSGALPYPWQLFDESN